MNQIITKELLLENLKLIPEIFGVQDVNLKLIEKKFEVRITTRENQIKVKGSPENINIVDVLLTQLEGLAVAGCALQNGDIKFAIRLVAENPSVDLKAIFTERIAVAPNIAPRSTIPFELHDHLEADESLRVTKATSFWSVYPV